MKAAYRFTALTLALAALGAAGVAVTANNVVLQPMVLAALLWLVLIGWGFHRLLQRYLGFQDRLDALHAELRQERGARLMSDRALDDAHSALSKLIDGQDQVRDTERQRIARDIHDDLGQNLLALKIELGLLQADPGQNNLATTRMVGRMSGNLDLTIKSLRAIINDLRPLALEDGLQTAIESHLHEFTRINNIRHHLEADPHAFRAVPDRGIDATLYRILQESLSNVVRHAQATEVKIALTCNADQLMLKVQDNGVGMAAPPSGNGCGLVSMEDRVTALGGKLSIDSQPGAGTLICLSIPLSPSSSAA
ncbi:MAG: sensor histidine kinase [Massilia sp.]